MLLIACACAAQLWVSAASAQGIRVQDDRGVTVQWAQAPQRVVSLLPSLTESVCALGACGRLVGVDRYSNFPDQVRQLPQLGGGLDPQLERVVLLKPDVVLVALGTRVVESLCNAWAYPYWPLTPKTWPMWSGCCACCNKS